MRRGAVEDVATDADQSEFTAMRLGTAPVDEGVRDDSTVGAVEEEVPPGSHTERAFDRSGEQERRAGPLTTEIERRQRVGGAGYPFRLDGAGLRYVPSASLVYEFCLAVSCAPSLTRRPYNALPIAFEHVTANLVQCLLGGPLAESYRTGWPRPRNTSPRFMHVVQELKKVTGCEGEWNWDPHSSLPPDPDSRQVKEFGLDVVAWRLLGDGRHGNIYMLGQCACGQYDDYEEKKNQLDVDHLQGWWVRPICSAPIVRFFSYVRHLPNSTSFMTDQTKTGLLLDRARLSRIAAVDANRELLAGRLPQPLIDLIRIVVPEFAVASRAPSRRP